MLTGDIAIQGDQGLDGIVVDRRGGRGQARVALGDGVRPAVVGADMNRRPRVTTQVAGLGPRLCDRDLDGEVALVEVVGHVRQLRPAVALDGGQHAQRVPAEQGQQLVVENLASHIESLRLLLTSWARLFAWDASCFAHGRHRWW